MIYLKSILPFIILLTLFSCGHKQIDVSKVLSKEQLFFNKAEDRFEKKLYVRALELYKDFIYLYPDSELVPKCLIKIGAIFYSWDQFDKASKIFTQIIDKHPESNFVQDAVIENFKIYYIQGDFSKIILMSKKFPDEQFPGKFILRKNDILGDAFYQVDDFNNAILSYAKAYGYAKNRAKKKIEQKLDKSIGKLNGISLEILLNNKESDFLNEKLLYSLGNFYNIEKNYFKSAKFFSDYISQYPDSPRAKIINNLLEDLEKKAAFNKNSVGCLLPLSGKYQTFGLKALMGVELAYQHFSKNNISFPIKLFIQDTEADSEKTITAFKTLQEKNIAAIIGPIITADTAAEKAQTFGIPIITFSQKENVVMDREYVFRNFLTPKLQIKTLVSYVINTLGLKKFAVLYPDEKYGITFMNLFWDKVIEFGGTIVGCESYSTNQTDFVKPINNLIGKNSAFKKYFHNYLPESDKKNSYEGICDFEAVFIPDGPEKVGLILPQFTYYDIKDIKFLGTNLWHSDKLIKMAGRYVQDSIIPEVFFRKSKNTHLRKFAFSFEKTFNSKPGFIEAIAYDSAMILFKTLSLNSVNSRKILLEQLQKIKLYPGVTGETSFDNNGDAEKNLYLLTIRKNRFIELDH